MNIGIIGLGYVGVVTGTCLSSLGHKIYGCDISKRKVDLLSKGRMPFIEPGCEELLKKDIENKLINFSTNIVSCLNKSDIIIVCVGTPSNNDDSVNLAYIKKVITQIGEYMLENDRWLGICIRSTIPAGTVRNIVLPILEKKSKKYIGKDYGVSFCPEFLREGNAIKDFFYPPLTVVASSDEKIEKKMENLWQTLPGEFNYLKVSFEEAEMCKYTSNAFHALKISFANEIGLLSKKLGANGDKVMNIMMSDKILNISEKYLKPGFAFGGSCLPKDLRALKYMAKNKKIDVPLLNSILISNNSLIESVAEILLNSGENRFGFAGIAFKDGTDDLRESSVLKLIYMLHKEGKHISIYDKHINPKLFTGVNQEIWESLIADINPIYKNNIEEFLLSASFIVTHGNQDEVHTKLGNHDDKIIFDLNNLSGDLKLN